MVGNKWQISDELWEKMAPLIPEHRTLIQRSHYHEFNRHY